MISERLTTEVIIDAIQRIEGVIEQDKNDWGGDIETDVGQALEEVVSILRQLLAEKSTPIQLQTLSK